MVIGLSKDGFAEAVISGDVASNYLLRNIFCPAINGLPKCVVLLWFSRIAAASTNADFGIIALNKRVVDLIMADGICGWIDSFVVHVCVWCVCVSY